MTWTFILHQSAALLIYSISATDFFTTISKHWPSDQCIYTAVLVVRTPITIVASTVLKRELTPDFQGDWVTDNNTFSSEESAIKTPQVRLVITAVYNT